MNALDSKENLEARGTAIDKLPDFGSLPMIKAVLTEYRTAAQITSNGDWVPIAQALLADYADNVYLSCTKLHGRTHNFYRYNVMAKHDQQQRQIGIIDSTFILGCPVNITPMPLIVTRDVLFSPAVPATSGFSFNGEIQSTWLIKNIRRSITTRNSENTKCHKEIVQDAEVQDVSKRVSHQFTGGQFILQGTTGSDVLLTELYLLKRQVNKHQMELVKTNETGENLRRNV
ncbi:unnamed protein product [Rotaria sp. Silwood2]|nr:unnamed protein product [Rotaria sp. Silwood2]CAF2812815.1 unnamed protein product [Rotaria sp. Silwood2]CAF2888099.1 unnamed protein product [Rotaria sp. Silwood2]CAF3953248.1 unnamed protein product [Rotaria sp. Silwood2]CAF4214313.1 unnamed protein product [Rotaria sp. Silwood2]